MGQLTLLGAGKPPSAAASLAFTGTDARVNESVGYATTATFNTVAIGTASAGREIVVGVFVYLAGSGGAITGITVGGEALTKRKDNGQTDVEASIWSGNVPTGTTATVVVTCSSTIDDCHISVGYFDNAVTAGTGASIFAPSNQNSPYTTTAAITVASGGFGIGFCIQTPGNTAAWANLTNEASAGADGTVYRVIMGQTSTPGSISPSATASNFQTVSVVAVPFA